MFSIRISNRKSETKLLWPVLLYILGCRLAGALSHMNDNATFFEAHFIHERFHQVDSTSMNEPDVFGGRRIRHLINLKSLSFVLYSD